MKIIAVIGLLAAMFLSAAEKPQVVRLVRHGQPGVEGSDFTPADRKAWISLGLTPLGRKQAELTGQYLKKENVQWKKVIASPQERAAETADIICGCIGKTYTLEPNLREIGNAIPETLSALRRRFKNIDPEAVLELTPQQRRRFKENNTQQGIRGQKVIMDLLSKKIRGPVLLVTHGNFIYATVYKMTGKKVSPWNCGMAELKVWPDGKAELVKAAYPEIFTLETLTSNQFRFHMNPWSLTFLPYPAKRPEDPLTVFNGEFQNFLAGKISSWRRSGGTLVKNVSIQDGKIVIRSQKSPQGLFSPTVPLVPGGNYRCVIRAQGKGAIVCSFQSYPYGPHKQKMDLDVELRDHEFKFNTRMGEKIFFSRIEIEPNSECTIAGCTLVCEK